MTDTRGIINKVSSALELKSHIMERYVFLVNLAALARVEGEGKVPVSVQDLREIDLRAMEVGSLIEQYTYWHDVEEAMKEVVNHD